MSELESLTRLDPARDLIVDREALRAMIDVKIESTPEAAQRGPQERRPWLRAVVVLAVALAAFVPVSFLDREPEPRFVPALDAPGDLATAVATLGLGGGGVKTVAVDGDTIWVMNALQRRLDRIDADTHSFVAQYEIDAYVEGVELGGGYLWLSSYDDGGELLRFDPDTGMVDLTIPTNGAPVKRWLGDVLWFSDGDGLHQVGDDGEAVLSGPEQIKGDGLGLLWVYDPGSGSIRAMTGPGTFTGEPIPPGTAALGDRLAAVREVAEAGGYIWLLDGSEDLLGSSVTRFDPSTGELLPLSLAPGLIDIAGHDGDLWVTSLIENLLIRVDAASGEHEYYPLPGRPGPVFEASDALWVGLYQPGALVRVDPDVMASSGARIVDLTIDGNRLLCTAGASTDDAAGAGPTVLLDANSWIGYGSWSVVQAQLSELGVTSCAFGSIEPEGMPEQAPGALASLLEASGVQGPYVLAAALDGVHSSRLFAEGRDDIAGVVLVDPIPVGFQELYDRLLPGWGHPPWMDLDAGVSDGLAGWGDIPVVVIQQDPDRFFLNSIVVDEIGEETATELLDFYQDGIAFYAGLSSDSSVITAPGAAFDGILWEQPGLVSEQIERLVAGG